MSDPYYKSMDIYSRYEHLNDEHYDNVDDIADTNKEEPSSYQCK